MKPAVSIDNLKSIILDCANKIRVIIVKTKMKSSNKALMGTSALVAVILAGAYSASSAYQGDYTQKGPNYSDERHEIMEQAFENNDYNAWKELMEESSKGRVLKIINEDNFDQFVKAHELAEEGRYGEADEIRRELGLRTRDGERMGSGYGKGDGEGRGQGRMNGN